ncbi:MAG: S1 family peptidase [Nocardioides sp.]|nr:S1 family peptidase [Nocardioides sp.]
MTTHPRDQIRRSARLLLLAWVGVLSLLVPSVAHAITNGNPTKDDEYTHVGAFIVEVLPAEGAPYLIQLCTGTLISPQVVLTASHCMVRDDYAPEWGEVFFTLDKHIGDGKSWRVYDSVSRLEGTPVPDPDYTGKAHYAYDVGAFVLKDALAAAPYPQFGTLDRSLRGTTFTTVGYGIERYDKQKSTGAFMPPKERMVATQPLTNVTPQYATFSMNLARGHGGTCYGDSGGPHFNAAGEIVAVTTTGDIPCKATDQATRTDTEAAQDFITGVLANPDKYAAP